MRPLLHSVDKPLRGFLLVVALSHENKKIKIYGHADERYADDEDGQNEVDDAKD